MTHLTHVKAELQKRLLALQARVGAVDRDLRSAHDDDWAERAVEIENDPVLERLDETTRAEVLAVTRALQRIESGQYGICAVCEGRIAEARLRAEPAAVTCVSCARRS